MVKPAGLTAAHSVRCCCPPPPPCFQPGPLQTRDPEYLRCASVSPWETERAMRASPSSLDEVLHRTPLHEVERKSDSVSPDSIFFCFSLHGSIGAGRDGNAALSEAVADRTGRGLCGFHCRHCLWVLRGRFCLRSPPRWLWVALPEFVSVPSSFPCPPCSAAGAGFPPAPVSERGGVCKPSEGVGRQRVGFFSPKPPPAAAAG